MMSRIERKHRLSFQPAAGSRRDGYCARRGHARGFGIVELMIAMALGAVILLAVSELFLSNTRSRAEIEKSGRQMENGRFVLQMLADEIGNAGFAGESGGFLEENDEGSDDEEGEQGAAVASAAAGAGPRVCAGTGASSEVLVALSAPVFGGTGDPGCLANSSVTPKDESQYIALRRASSVACPPDACDQRREAYFLQVGSRERGGVFEREVARRANVKTELTLITSNNTLAPIYPFLSRIYFVNNAGVLYRQELLDDGGPKYQRVPMVEGIEHVAFEYGLDETGDGVPDAYKSASGMEGSLWRDVTAVRVWVLARNLEPTPGYQDDNTYQLGDGSSAVTVKVEAGFTAHKRQVYSTTVRVNNVAGRP